MLGPLFLAACSYDLDRLERAGEAREDAGGSPDGAPGDAGEDAGPEVPEALIDLFEEARFFSAECRRCARDNCAEANETCHGDPECEAATACFARSNDPRNQAECREEHRDWFLEHIDEFDVGGPFFDCVFSRDCKSQCGADENLECVGDFRWPSIENSAEIELALSLYEALTLEASAGARAKVCRIEDLQCDEPSMTDTADEHGRVDLVLPAPRGRFTGYIEITGAGLAPTLLVFGWPLTTADARRMPMVSQGSVDLQEMIGGRTKIPGTGMVQPRVRGCNGVGTKDVRIEVSPTLPATETWYFREPLPTFDVDATSSDGNAGVINVRPGIVDVVGTWVPTDRQVLRWQVPVRGEHLTILVTAPLDR